MLLWTSGSESNFAKYANYSNFTLEAREKKVNDNMEGTFFFLFRMKLNKILCFSWLVLDTHNVVDQESTGEIVSHK